MLNKQYTSMLQEKDVIFEIFQYATERAKVVGAENIYDFSLGNPSVPAPSIVNETIVQKVNTLDPLALHGYSPSFGIMETREKIAVFLNKKYGSSYKASNIFMAIGAAGALAHAFRAVTNPGDEIITFTPCFSEYKPYTAGLFGELIKTAVVFSFNCASNAAKLIWKVSISAGIMVSFKPAPADILTEKSKEFGHPIYLISDEPYRDIIFEGVDAPYVANYYKNTLTCYSFSKSISLPGERIGYLAVHPDCIEANKIIEICPQISRTIGQNGAASLMQRTVADVCNYTSDLSVYETNKKILFEALKEYGYHCVEPGGTFYMFPRSLEPDSQAFCKKAMEKDLMLVPGDIFGCPGHFRIAYCVPTERVEKALPIFQELAEEYL